MSDIAINFASKWTLALQFALVCFVGQAIVLRASRAWYEWQRGCSAIPRYPQKVPYMGFDIAFGMAKSLKNHTFLLWLRNLHDGFPGKSKTFTIDFLGRHVIHTIEPENMKHLSSIVWQDFGVEPLRRQSGASMPFADKGVNTTDGHDWAFSRFLIKPYFLREAFSDTNRLKEHTDNLLSLIPLDESTFDMQILLQRWVCVPVWTGSKATMTNYMASSSIRPAIFCSASQSIVFCTQKEPRLPGQ